MEMFPFFFSIAFSVHFLQLLTLWDIAYLRETKISQKTLRIPEFQKVGTLQDLRFIENTLN